MTPANAGIPIIMAARNVGEPKSGNHATAREIRTGAIFILNTGRIRKMDKPIDKKLMIDTLESLRRHLFFREDVLAEEFDMLGETIDMLKAQESGRETDE